MAKEIKFNVKQTVDGKEQLVSDATSVNNLRGIDSIKTVSDKAREWLILFNLSFDATRNVSPAVNKFTEESGNFSVAMKETNTMAGAAFDGMNSTGAQPCEKSNTRCTGPSSLSIISPFLILNDGVMSFLSTNTDVGIYLCFLSCVTAI